MIGEAQTMKGPATHRTGPSYQASLFGRIVPNYSVAPCSRKSAAISLLAALISSVKGVSLG
jgi:hypothetical protein